METEWRDVVNWEGIYKVSNEGDVCSVDRIIPDGRKRKGILLTPKVNKKDAGLYVTLCWGGEEKTAAVHQLVYQAFIGDIPDGYRILHKDGNTKNNVSSNLELRPERHFTEAMQAARRRFSQDDIRDILGSFMKGESAYSMAKRYGTKKSSIQSVLSKHRLFRTK